MFTIPDKGEGVSNNQSIFFQEYLDTLVKGIATQEAVISGCAVSPNAGMQLSVTSGQVRTSSVLTSVSSATPTLSAAHATNARFDFVVVTSGGVVAVRTGTATVSPIPPAVVAGDVVLAVIYVPATTVTVLAAHIVDLRVFTQVATLNQVELLTNKTLNNAVITSSGSSNALRITQTGTGNCLVVEDSANPDSTPFVIDSAGAVGIGAVPVAGVKLALSGTDTVASAVTTDYAFVQAQTANNSVHGRSTIIAATATAAPTDVRYNSVSQGTFASGAAVTSQYGYFTAATLTGATNNYGFYGSLSSATGCWNFYAGGTAQNYFAGNVLIGTTTASASTDGLYVSKAPTTPTTQAIRVDTRASSTSNGGSTGVYSLAITAANSGTLYTAASITHFSALQAAFHADATVTDQYGFNANSTLTGATNNYGFYGNLSSATGRWNFYANGTARNFFAGTTTLNAGLARTPTRSTVASGSTVVLTTSANHLLYDNAATAAALTVTLPSTDLIDGLEITIATRSIITSLTVNGGTIYGAPTTLAAGGFATFIYSSSGSAWFRKG